MLGVTIYADIILPQAKKLEQNLIAHQTKLGWILFGTACNYSLAKKRSYISAVVTNNPINDVTINSLKQFFTMEEPPAKQFKTKEQMMTEEIFANTHYRTANGRYGVCLPFKSNQASLGQSRENAKRQFFALEKRLNRMTEIKKKYVEFMREFID